MDMDLVNMTASQLREMIMARVIYAKGWEIFLKYVFMYADNMEVELPDEFLEDLERHAVKRRGQLELMIEEYVLKVAAEYH